MIEVRLCTAKQIPDCINLLYKAQKEKNVGLDETINPDSFAQYMVDCIFGSGVYPFIAVENNEVVGLLVLNEVTCPWNHEKVHGTDLLFLALKGGLKLFRTAKALMKKKNWDSIIWTTSMNNERADKLLDKLTDKIGGVYKMKNEAKL